MTAYMICIDNKLIHNYSPHTHTFAMAKYIYSPNLTQTIMSDDDILYSLKLYTHKRLIYRQKRYTNFVQGTEEKSVLCGFL